MNINVTKPFFPPLEEYQKLLEGIWRREWLTNNGPLVNELELRLKQWLGIDHMLFVANGTIALQITIKALGLEGEVITTPFSYVATTSSLVWENCRPVMVDICPRSLNIDPAKIEAAITNKTTGIMATHVFGNPCDVRAIEEIAARHNLKVIYDAAHAFGVKVHGRSIFSYGTISATSFHATKLFHTCEGGGLFSEDSALIKYMSQLRNFGHVTPTEFGPAGINGKSSELHAGIGLLVLPHIEKIIQGRRQVSAWYDELLKDRGLQFQIKAEDTEHNCAYYPVIFDSENTVLKIIEILNNHNIFPRRYFYPSLSQLNYVDSKDTPIANDISARILCLPLYDSLTKEEVDMIGRLIIRALKY